MKFIVEIDTNCTVGMILTLHSFADWLFHSSDRNIENVLKTEALSHAMGDTKLTLTRID